MLVQVTSPCGDALPKYENARHFLGDNSSVRQYSPNFEQLPLLKRIHICEETYEAAFIHS